MRHPKQCGVIQDVSTDQVVHRAPPDSQDLSPQLVAIWNEPNVESSQDALRVLVGSVTLEVLTKFVETTKGSSLQEKPRPALTQPPANDLAALTLKDDAAMTLPSKMVFQVPSA